MARKKLKNQKAIAKRKQARKGKPGFVVVLKGTVDAK